MHTRGIVMTIVILTVILTAWWLQTRKSRK